MTSARELAIQWTITMKKPRMSGAVLDRSHALRGNAATDAPRLRDAERPRIRLPRWSVGAIILA